MMRLRAIVSVLVAVAVWTVTARAQSVRDSLSMATATMWSQSLKSFIDNNFSGDTSMVDAYVKGVATAFSMPESESPYYIGVSQGLQLVQRIATMRSIGIDVDTEVLCRELASLLKGGKASFTQQQANDYLNNYVESLAPATANAVDEQKEQAFIDSQLSRPGVVKTSSGLVFETLHAGTGASPELHGKVKITYKGQLSDGKVFDSTDDPVTFDVSRLVKGFTEGLLLMKEGGSYRLYIPSSLGYGARGIEGTIPGNAALVFDVALIEVVNP